MLENEFFRKKVKLEEKGSHESLSYCRFCNTYSFKDEESHSCQKCGAISEELDFQADEKFVEKPKYIPHSHTYWALQSYDVELSREYLIRRHIKDISSKIEIPEFIQRNVETFVKKLIAKNPTFAKSLKNLCISCIFLNMRQKDPAYSIKNFSDAANLKPKTVLKHMNTIKPYFFEGEHSFYSSSQRINQENYEAYLVNFIQKLDLKQLSSETDLGLALLTVREENKENIKLDNILGPENIVSSQGFTYETTYKTVEDIVKSKIIKYGIFLINSDFLYSIKFGKNTDNFVISIIVIILRAFSVPITMKKICELEELSTISVSRMTKEIISKIMDEYMNQLELLSTTQQTFDSTQISASAEDKEVSQKEKTEENCVKKVKNDDSLKKAIKLLYKKYPYQN